MKKIALGIILGLIVGLVIGLKLNKGQNDLGVKSGNILNGNLQSENVNDFSYLNLPLNYFNQDKVKWGEVATNESGKYQRASFTDGTQYQSYPTTKTTIVNYSNEVKQLRKPTTLIGLKNEVDYVDIMLNNYEEFGSLALNFLPEYSISSKDEFDVDMDGKPEIIISLFGVGGNHPPHFSQIIKGGKVIFTVEEERPMIYPTDTNNGFYVEWYPDKFFNKGLCCPYGLTKTRFVYEDKEFKPVYEQEVIFTKVGKESER